MSDSQSAAPGSATAPRAGAEPGDAVSFPDEQLLLVDADDRLLGYGSKQRLHAGDGLLHRAFSVFLFDAQGRLLLHRRSDRKPLWPGFWTNSCCSHPRRNEQLGSAVSRRLREELGVQARNVEEIYRFEYRARYRDIGSEYELCHVFLARLVPGSEPRVHPEEISEYRWLSPAEVDEWMTTRSDELTPWFRMEWQTLRGERREALQRFVSTGAVPQVAHA